MEKPPTDEPPRCPGCGSIVATVLTQTLEYRVEGEQRVGEPISVMIVYKCPCGRAFTHRVSFDSPADGSESPRG